jgi:hypothetical protein
VHLPLDAEPTSRSHVLFFAPFSFVASVAIELVQYVLGLTISADDESHWIDGFLFIVYFQLKFTGLDISARWFGRKDNRIRSCEVKWEEEGECDK